MSIPPSLLSLNGNSEVVRDHEMRRAMKANVVDKMAVTPRLDLWGPLEHYPNDNTMIPKRSTCTCTVAGADAVEA
jgi:hypothetical protein